MRCDTVRSPLCALLSGLLLAACGVVPEAPTHSEEALGTHEAAVCAGLSVTTLTIADASSFQGELAGNGSWAVSTSANAVRLEYYVDGVMHATEERPGTSGTWYFSAGGIACGAHTFTVKAFPMVIDSAGNRTTCWSNPRSVSKTVWENSTVMNIVKTTSYSSSNVAYLKCPGGKPVLGGGCSDDFNGTSLKSTRPWGSDGWVCEFASQPGSLTAYAMCGCREVTSTGKTSGTGNVLTATCPSGKVVVGGGCSDDYFSTQLQSSMPNGSNGWTCRFQGNPGSLTVTAHCVDPVLSPGLQTVTATTSSSNVAFVKCPSGKKVIGGGCRDDWAATVLQSSRPWDTDGWVCNFRNVTGSLTVYALCESK